MFKGMKEDLCFTNDTLLNMNKNDEDLDLALALGSANYNRVQTESNYVSGAGVNAKLKVDMAFAASDPLSELVWSPHKGLSLKCADSSLADKKPFLLWNVGPSRKVSSPSQSNQAMGVGDKVAIDDGILTLSSPMPNLETKLVENTGDLIEEGACTPSFIQVDSCKINKYMEEDVAYNARGNDVAELEVASCSEPNATKLSKNSYVQSPVEPRDKETSTSGGSKQNKDDILCSMLEVSAENELCNPIVKEAQSLGEMKLPSPPNEVCLYQETGKEKALSDGDIYRRLANGDDDGSNESVESCNSVGFLSRAIKRQSCDQDSTQSNKRMKKQGSHGSTSMIKPHSSFMNWISNMVKGFTDSCNEEPAALGLTLSCMNDVQAKDDRETFACIKTCGSPNLGMGFQTMFQSLYGRDTKALDTVAPVEHGSVQESEELVIENTSIKHSPRSFQGGNENTCKQMVVSNVQENPCLSRNIVGQPSQPWVFSADMSCAPFSYETNLAENEAVGNIRTCDGTAANRAPSSSLAMRTLPGKGNYLTSLWITRLSTKSPQLGKGEQTNQVAVERHTKYLNVIPASQRNDVFSSDQNHSKSMADSHEEHAYASSKEIQRLASNPEVSSDGKCANKIRPTHPTPEFSGSSEAMASVFARRLGALKRNVPTKRVTNVTRSSMCFFCGKSSHDLRECPEVTETEMEELLVKTSLYDMIEESNSLCIRCFQFDHWAISCPSGLANKHCQSEKDALGVNPNIIMSENEFKENRGQSFPFLGVVTSKNNNTPAEIFHAIRKLRLSRVDVLKWMDSHVSSTHLNGFFLRLRLAKLESGLGGTGYCVACIIGDTRENIVSKSKKSILVDVGGIKSSIGSQYISNDDFLEDEIKAWWCRISKTGCKLPSLDELNSRFKHRMSFGF